MRKQHYEKMKGYGKKVATGRNDYKRMESEGRISSVFTEKPHYGIQEPVKGENQG